MEDRPSDEHERAGLADRRDDDADAREAEADQRERRIDARERVLDRWECEIAERAAALNLLDEVEEKRFESARTRRSREREHRRDEAEARRDEAIERDIRRDERVARAESDRPSSGSDDASPAVFARLATALQANPPLDEVLEVILAAGVDTVPGCAAASVALTTHGRRQTAASTATWAADLDAAQLELGCGPLPTAADGAMESTTDLTADARWPRLADLHSAGAARAVVSVGLVVGGTDHGVLTLYSDLGGHFGQQALRIADLLAAHAAAALARTLERRTYEAQAEALHHALASRDVIGQAKGIMMEQRSITADEAYLLLRETSQRLNIKLRDVAQHVVAQRRLPDA